MKKESITRTFITGTLCAAWFIFIVAVVLLLTGCGRGSATQDNSDTATVESESVTDDNETAKPTEAASSENDEDAEDSSELPHLSRDLGLGIKVTGAKNETGTQYEYRRSESSYDETYQSADDITKPILNSVTDHPLIGDERNFVYVQKVEKDGRFRVNIGPPDQPFKIEPGNYYDIIMFLRNDASADTEADRERLATPPLDGIIMAPTVIEPGKEEEISCTIGRSVMMNEEGDRTEPEINSVFSGVTVCADEPVHLLYGSDKLLVFFGEEYKEGFSNDARITSLSSKQTQEMVVWPTFTIKRNIFPSEEGSFLIYTFYAEAAKDKLPEDGPTENEAGE